MWCSLQIHQLRITLTAYEAFEIPFFFFFANAGGEKEGGLRRRRPRQPRDWTAEERGPRHQGDKQENEGAAAGILKNQPVRLCDE